MSKISSPLRHSTSVLLFVGIFVALTSCSVSMSKPPTSGVADRVAQAFDKISVDVSHKDGFTSVWSAPKLAVGTSLSTDQKVTLWVASKVSKGLVTRGYYVDVTSNKSTAGMSLWSRPTLQVSLYRMESVVVGDVGSWPAKTVRVLGGGSSVNLPVNEGYFLVPTNRTSNISQKFTVILLNKTGGPIGTVSDLSAPGSGNPH
jgi:hypothetical protein